MCLIGPSLPPQKLDTNYMHDIIHSLLQSLATKPISVSDVGRSASYTVRKDIILAGTTIWIEIDGNLNRKIRT